MSLTPQQLDALEAMAAASVTAERATGVPAELSCAQCILESDWLARAPSHNCFGIKSTDGTGQYLLTKEYMDGTWKSLPQLFETYPTLAASFIAHGRLLTEGRPYADAWEQYREDPQHDLDTLIGGISRRYATDPAYGQEIMTLAHGPHLTAAIAVARAQQP